MRASPLAALSLITLRLVTTVKPDKNKYSGPINQDQFTKTLN